MPITVYRGQNTLFTWMAFFYLAVVDVRMSGMETPFFLLFLGCLKSEGSTCLSGKLSWSSRSKDYSVVDQLKRCSSVYRWSKQFRSYASSTLVDLLGFSLVVITCGSTGLWEFLNVRRKTYLYFVGHHIRRCDWLVKVWIFEFSNFKITNWGLHFHESLIFFLIVISNLGSCISPSGDYFWIPPVAWPTNNNRKYWRVSVGIFLTINHWPAKSLWWTGSICTWG